MRIRVIPVSSLAAGLLAGLAWLTVDEQSERPVLPPVSAPVLLAAPASAPAPRPSDAASAAPLSLPFRQDAAGNLQLDADTALALELSCHAAASGQHSPSAAELAPRAWQQQRALQTRYCAYRKAAHANALPPDSLAAARRQLAALIDLRRRFFDSATADGLFGVEEAQALHTLDVARIEQDTALDAAEKAARIASLPTAALDPPAPTPAELALLRAQAGDDARQQLQRMHEIESRWESRYRDYAAEKQLILVAGLAEGDKAAQVEGLLRKHFAASELAAARTFDLQRHGDGGH